MEIPSTELLLANTIASQGTPAFPAHLNDWLVSVTEPDNTTVLAYYQDQRPKLLYSNSFIPNVHRHMENVYLAGAYLFDPYYELHRRKEATGLYRIWDIAPDKFSHNRYFIEYYRRTTIVDEIGFVVWPSDGISIHVCLGRDARSNRRFSAKQIAQARAITPLVDTLARGHWKTLEFEGEALEETAAQRIVRTVAETRNINLTNRQAEVAFLILQGHSSMSISLRLGISVQTVKVFRKQLYKRCQVSSQAELFTLLMPILTLNGDTFSLAPDLED